MMTASLGKHLHLQFLKKTPAGIYTIISQVAYKYNDGLNTKQDTAGLVVREYKTIKETVVKEEKQQEKKKEEVVVHPQKKSLNLT